MSVSCECECVCLPDANTGTPDSGTPVCAGAGPHEAEDEVQCKEM